MDAQTPSEVVAENPVTETAPPEIESTQPDNEQEVESSLEAEWFKNQDGDTTTGTEDTTPEPAPQAPTQDKPETPAPSLSAEELTTIRRYGLKDDADIAAIALLPAAQRGKLIASFAQRAAFVDQLVQARQTPPSQSPPAQQPQAAGQQTAPVQSNDADAVWASLSEQYDESLTAPLKKLFETEVTRRVDQRVQPIEAFIQQQEVAKLQQQFATAYDALALPPGVDKARAETRAAVETQAIRLMQLDPTLTFEHAVPTAAASNFAKEYTAATQQQRVAQQAKNLRGSPTRTSAIPKSRSTVPSEEDAERDWFAANRD